MDQAIALPFAPPSELIRWQTLLPRLESELTAELKLFRRFMRVHRIDPDYVNRDVVPAAKSGAWEILRQQQTIDDRPRSFVLYVRRSTNQFAVIEDNSYFGLGPLFTRAFPWHPPTADAVRDALQARMLL